MKLRSPIWSKASGKVATGITGFDEMTGGGLPQGRTSLLVGGPGCGKTIFGLQFLAHGARECNEPGIFVAFEENSQRIAVNAESFGWQLGELRQNRIFFLDAQPTPDLIPLGNFDIGGMLEALDFQIKQMGAKRIVFDAIDIILALLPNSTLRKREIYRLHEWLLAHNITGLITAKAGGGDADTAAEAQSLGFMQFMVDCAVILTHKVALGISQRNIRVLKYRGSSFDENEAPFVINANGLEVGLARNLNREQFKVTHERISSGLTQLDDLLEGGYYRRSCVLITGEPGTGKSTLGAAFAAAACRRGERALLVSFDTDGSEVMRNLSSVGINLARHVKSGLLRMRSARSIIGSAGAHLVRIKTLVQEHAATCLVIDPVSTLSKAVNEFSAHTVTELLIDWAKAQNISLVCTGLHATLPGGLGADSTLPHLATLADILIHVEYKLHEQERVRYLSILKARGTAHSTKVWKFVLSQNGVGLAGATDSAEPVPAKVSRRKSKRSAANRAPMQKHR